MKTIPLTLVKPHDGQLQVKREAKRFNVLACGRRWGKTTLSIELLAVPALNGKPTAYFAPNYTMVTEFWRELTTTLKPVIARQNATEHRLELITGGVIDLWSLDAADSVRGRKYARVIPDEAAMVKDLGEAYHAVIRPTLTDYAGDCYFLSTPRGRNAFHQFWLYGQDPDRPEWASWQMPTTANPHILPSEVESARQELPERVFRQEFLAEFLEFEGAVFRKVIEAATASLLPRGKDGAEYVVGADWGRHNDFTVFLVADVKTREVVAMDRFTQIDFEAQANRLKAICSRFPPRVVLAEENSFGAPVIERLQKDGLPVRAFTTTNATKAEIVQSLALSFEQGNIRIPNDPVLLGELLSYEATRLPSGMMRYSAPEGMHDDTVIALALANAAMGRKKIELTMY